MKNLLLIFGLLLIVSCGKEQHDLTVKGTIKDLKKGTLYLQKFQDSSFIIIDSLIINGDSNFELHANLDSPEVFFLRLNKTNSDAYGKIPFFADKGVTVINTSVKDFSLNPEIKGSKQHVVFEEYFKMMDRYNNKNLDLIKAEFDAKNDTILIAANNKAYQNLIKSRYLYTVNFAIKHKDSEVAPYLALTEIYDAQTKWLDTINNSLTPEIKASKYGKELDVFIKDRKAN
ncbi:DUF4369 domain-containing protein [Bizionia argentinensis JUB59]|uniref:DUF4369 domain-containing protein n=1 Tax=Bizionia argentinensis JUB59 TaxID=1046627 RepID=G2EG33_9FLAO|nr:DUF4369 domain-containing protein [Bizionia argentinensis]EGV42589.1 DUF4369 domain-containing protein [Bizionia argentinensis JUB59]